MKRLRNTKVWRERNGKPQKEKATKEMLVAEIDELFAKAKKYWIKSKLLKQKGFFKQAEALLVTSVKLEKCAKLRQKMVTKFA